MGVQYRSPCPFCFLTPKPRRHNSPKILVICRNKPNLFSFAHQILLYVIHVTQRRQCYSSNTLAKAAHDIPRIPKTPCSSPFNHLLCDTVCQFHSWWPLPLPGWATCKRKNSCRWKQYYAWFHTSSINIISHDDMLVRRIVQWEGTEQHIIYNSTWIPSAYKSSSSNRISNSSPPR